MADQESAPLKGLTGLYLQADNPPASQESKLPDYFKPLEKLIESYPSLARPDVRSILTMDEAGFEGWFFSRFKAASTLLDQYKLIGEIPELSYPPKNPIDMDGHSNIGMMIDCLEKAVLFLDVIKQARRVLKSQK